MFPCDGISIESNIRTDRLRVLSTSISNLKVELRVTFWLDSVNGTWGWSLICNFQSLGVDVYCVQATQFNACDHKDILSRRFSLSMFWWPLKRCWLASEHVFKCDVFLFSQMWWAYFVCWILPLFHWGIFAGWYVIWTVL